ncbi:MAG: hypothetical protein ABSG51_11685 [Terracidiphilus sp.]
MPGIKKGWKAQEYPICADKTSKAHLMIGFPAPRVGVGLVLLAAHLLTAHLPSAQISGANEVFPVVHNELIMIRVLSGRDSHPLAHARVILVAGYDQRDIDRGMSREETLTDEHGNAQLSNALANFPWLRISILKTRVCQGGERSALISIERIRGDGLSASNRCGTARVRDVPGVFTVWVKARRTAAKSVAHATDVPRAGLPIPAPVPAPVTERSAAPVCPAIAAPREAPAPAPARNRRKRLTLLAPA